MILAQEEIFDASVGPHQLPGKVESITPGSVMTIVEVALDGGQSIRSSITKEAAEELGLEVGSP
jgi:molybdopterin-binding protein